MIPTITISSFMISELIGKEVLSDTIKSINSSVYSLQSFNIELVNNILEEIDIQKKIEIVNSLFDEEENMVNKTKILALNNLHEISEKIKNELEEIHKDIEMTKNMYFSYFRSKPYFKKLDKLRNHSIILDQRLDLVLKL